MLLWWSRWFIFLICPSNQLICTEYLTGLTKRTNAPRFDKFRDQWSWIFSFGTKAPIGLKFRDRNSNSILILKMWGQCRCSHIVDSGFDIWIWKFLYFWYINCVGYGFKKFILLSSQSWFLCVFWIFNYELWHKGENSVIDS